jgi:hypothetical protein
VFRRLALAIGKLQFPGQKLAGGEKPPAASQDEGAGTSLRGDRRLTPQFQIRTGQRTGIAVKPNKDFH